MAKGKRPDCLEISGHTPFPRGYASGDEYASELLLAGHRQVRCSGCGLYAIWLPTPPEAAYPDITPDQPERGADDRRWDGPESGSVAALAGSGAEYAPVEGAA